MSCNHSLPRLIIGWALLSIGAVACSSGTPPATQAQAKPATRWSHQDWPTGPYKVVEGWPKPLPDTRHSHDGWTWGSFGGVYAETPDRIWIAMRGELPLPAGRRSVDALRGAESVPRELQRQRRRVDGNVRAGDEAGMGAPLRALDHRVRSRRATSSTSGRTSTSCSPRLPCGRGPHQIKISPYDQEKHVWIIDDQLHMIYRFTYDGKLVHSKGQLGVRGRGPNTFDRPTDIAWLPDGTYFITDGYGGTRVAKYDKNDNFMMDWGQAAQGPEEPGTERVQYGPQHRDQQRPPALRRRPRTCPDAGVRRERQVPRHVAAEIAALARQSDHARGESLHR